MPSSERVGILYNQDFDLNALNDKLNIIQRLIDDIYNTNDVASIKTLTASGAGDFGSLNVGDSINYTEIKTDGEINLHGTGRVIKYTWIPAQGLAAHGAKAATWVTFANGISGAWQFADNADNAITFQMMVPVDMDLTESSTICTGWSSPVISGDCYWDIEYLITTINDDTDALASDSSGALHTSSATAGGDGLIRSDLITIAADTFTATDLCLHASLTRDVSGDALGDVAHIHGVAFGYTSNKYGTAT